MRKADNRTITPEDAQHGIPAVTAGRPEGFHRACIAIPVTLNRPTDGGREVIAGKLLCTMHDCGSVLYYRVSVGEGMCYLAPPHWLAADCRAAVAQASLAMVLA